MNSRKSHTQITKQVIPSLIFQIRQVTPSLVATLCICHCSLPLPPPLPLCCTDSQVTVLKPAVCYMQHCLGWGESG